MAAVAAASLTASKAAVLAGAEPGADAEAAPGPDFAGPDFAGAALAARGVTAGVTGPGVPEPGCGAAGAMFVAGGASPVAAGARLAPGAFAAGLASLPSLMRGGALALAITGEAAPPSPCAGGSAEAALALPFPLAGSSVLEGCTPCRVSIAAALSGSPMAAGSSMLEGVTPCRVPIAVALSCWPVAAATAADGCCAAGSASGIVSGATASWRAAFRGLGGLASLAACASCGARARAALGLAGAALAAGRGRGVRGSAGVAAASLGAALSDAAALGAPVPADGASVSCCAACRLCAQAA
ncbi:hypothetical protein [Acidocella facilis]|uniref:hypothetical protein n=1 Tax=Acidocella facilis TaxID=525 RepID=UPI001F2BF62E|nr:hypothetical protein [Acidocella facilis]